MTCPLVSVMLALPAVTVGLPFASYRAPSFSTTQYEAAKTWVARSAVRPNIVNAFFMIPPNGGVEPSIILTGHARCDGGRRTARTNRSGDPSRGKNGLQGPS